MALSIAKEGDVVVCVRPKWSITLGKKYRVLDVNPTSSASGFVYTIIDDTGMLFSSLYTSDCFLSLEEYRSTQKL